MPGKSSCSTIAGLKEARRRGLRCNQEKEGDQNAEAEDHDQQKHHGKCTPAVVSSPVALRQHIVSHHLTDLEAFFSLLGQGNSGTPPPSSEVGKLLSQVVARRSGPLPTVMERFSGE
ncbi:hypothetical protein R1flu_021115 [Riccia fluitans]|uniref:Uncharacterized protein n=1 Tax=Riccia fluitans TaxID=41844 RepID=A0ABD1ZPM0_9MARC